jgi:hypothetical protein
MPESDDGRTIGNLPMVDPDNRGAPIAWLGTRTTHPSCWDHAAFFVRRRFFSFFGST